VHPHPALVAAPLDLHPLRPDLPQGHPMTTEPEPADHAQLRDISIQFARHGITRRADRLLLTADHAGRRLDTSADLSWAEAAALQQRLRRLPVGTLPHVLGRLRAAEHAQHTPGRPDTPTGPTGPATASTRRGVAA
jgi:hypothetical protein